MNEWDVGNASPVKTDLVVVVFVSSGVHWYNIFETPFIRSLVKTIEDSLCVVASESGRLNGTESCGTSRMLGNGGTGTAYK